MVHATLEALMTAYRKIQLCNRLELQQVLAHHLEEIVAFQVLYHKIVEGEGNETALDIAFRTLL